MFQLLAFFLLVMPVAPRQATDNVPAEKELKALARESLLSFNKGVQEKDFSEFYEGTSSILKEQFTLEKFTKIFQAYIDKEVDISSIADVQPTFDDPPNIDSDGVLILKGHYPTRPNNVGFRLRYVSEGGQWKILGINVDTTGGEKTGGTATKAEVPSEKECKALALASLLAFNKAVQQKNFAGLHKEISELWRAQITPEKLKEIFKPFVEQGAKGDISAITKSDPTFTEPPAINDNGFLVLKGRYPTSPSVVDFELKYNYEASAWKLVGIDVNAHKE